MTVTAGFREPLSKGGEGLGGDRDEPWGGILNDRSRVNGSSFPAIKIVVTNISSLSYVWIRSLFATIGLLPYILFSAIRKDELLVISLKNGLIVGVVYAIGLWLQGYGTIFTSASNSAFITGLNTVFVHIYVAIFRRSYSKQLALSLLLSIIGLCFLTRPTGGLGKGDLIVLVSATFWATQVILVDRFSYVDPVTFTFGEMIPSMLFIIPDIMLNGRPTIGHKVILY